MKVHLFSNKLSMAQSAAQIGADHIRSALANNGQATVVLASAASQIEMLDCLVQAPEIAWHKVSLFHLDEYVGLPLEHPASFRFFLWKRFISRLPLPPREYFFLNAESNAIEECERVGNAILDRQVDVAFIGIGENCHLAFNDPPADLETVAPYIIVDLDEHCRQQQVDEGWFPTLADVPTRAVSMSVHQILTSRNIICTVPDKRKAKAVQATLEGPISRNSPASCLQTHENTDLFIDEPAASELSPETLERCEKHL